MFLIKETMERKGIHMLYSKGQGSIKYLNIHPTYSYPPRINQARSLMRHFIPLQVFIKEKLFEKHTLVEPLSPWFSNLFLTRGDLMCAAIRISLLFLGFPRLPKVGAIRRQEKNNGEES